MIRSFQIASLFALFFAAEVYAAPAADVARASGTKEAPIPFFEAKDSGQIQVKFIARNDHEARLIITNKTKQPIHLQLPEAFAGVPVAAQIGGGRGGGFGGGGRGGGGLGGGGGGQQSVGGGGGMGGGGMGGGGGMFSVPPDRTEKIELAVVCLDHGLRDPSSSRPYEIVPATDHIDRPAVVELLKAFGSGQLDHQAVQAAAWHLNNDMSWNELTAKLAGTRRSPSRPPYFNRQQIQAGIAYANEAARLAATNADLYKREFEKKREADQAKELESSESRSTTDEEAEEPAEKHEQTLEAAG